MVASSSTCLPSWVPLLPWCRHLYSQQACRQRLNQGHRLEYAKAGIRVNAIAPAGIETDMYESFVKDDAEKRKAFENMHPVGRVGQPEEIASALSGYVQPVRRL